MLRMIKVESSVIESMGWDKTNETLYVRFNSGASYAYQGVSESVFKAMLAHESKGFILNDWIKPNHKGVCLHRELPEAEELTEEEIAELENIANAY